MKKYKEALERMESSYFNCDNSFGAMKQFSADRDLLWNLINLVEKREEEGRRAYDKGFQDGFNKSYWI